MPRFRKLTWNEVKVSNNFTFRFGFRVPQWQYKSSLRQPCAITKILIPYQNQYFFIFFAITVSLSISTIFFCNIYLPTIFQNKFCNNILNFNIIIIALSYWLQFQSKLIKSAISIVLQYFQINSAISILISMLPNLFLNIISIWTFKKPDGNIGFNFNFIE